MVGLYTTNLQVVKTKKYDVNQVCEIFNRILRNEKDIAESLLKCLEN